MFVPNLKKFPSSAENEWNTQAETIIEPILKMFLLSVFTGSNTPFEDEHCRIFRGRKHQQAIALTLYLNIFLQIALFYKLAASTWQPGGRGPLKGVIGKSE